MCYDHCALHVASAFGGTNRTTRDVRGSVAIRRKADKAVTSAEGRKSCLDRIKSILNDARRQQQIGKVCGTALGGRGERAVEPSREDVSRAQLVMCRHDEVREHGLRRRVSRQRGEFGDDAVRPQVCQQVDLPQPRNLSPLVRQVDDFALCRSVDRAVRLVDKALRGFRMPVISARLLLVAVHALLHDSPFAVVGYEESVIETVTHSGAVDLRHQSACAGEPDAIETDAFTESMQFVRRLSRMLAAAAAHVDAEFVREGSQAALEGADRTNASPCP
jgi:hypothetical protein